MDSIKYQQIKNQQVTDSVRNLIMGRVWIFQPDNIPNTNLKNNTKMGHWAQNQASAMAIPVLWPEPCRKWVRWTEEKKHRHGAVNLKDLEWFWMKEWSLISCQVFSNLIRHYRRKFGAVWTGKWRFQEVLNKRVPLMWPMCIREKHLFHNYISPHFKFLLSNERLDFCDFFQNKRSKGLTMQINFHSLLWSYLPRVPVISDHDCIYIINVTYVCMYILLIK